MHKPNIRVLFFSSFSSLKNIFTFSISLILLFTSLTGLSSNNAGKNKGPKYRILYINSYHPGYPWSDQLYSSIKETIESHLGNKADLRVEYIDGKRYSTELEGELGKKLISQWATKYAGEKFDVLLVTDQPAYNLMRKARPKVFPNVPMIFAGVEDVGKLDKNTTGVLASTDIRNNINLILQVLPTTKRIWVITDNSITGKINRLQLEKLAAEFKDKVKIEFLEDGSGIDQDKLLAKTAQISKPDVIYFQDYSRSPAASINTMEFLNKLTTTAKVPVFSHVDIYIKYGVTGGKMNSPIIQGSQMAHMGIDALRGIPTELIAPQTENSHPTFDFEKLKKYNIPLTNLSVDCRFLNKTENLWDQYGWYIISILAFIVIESYLIILLFFLFRRQKRLKQEARISAERLKTLFQLAPIPMTYTNKSGQFLDLSSRFLEIIGYTLEDIPTLEEWWQKAYPDPDYRSACMDICMKKLEYLDVDKIINYGEYKIKCKNGQTRIMEVMSSKCGDTDELVSCFFDITAKKESEETLRKSEENLRVTLNSIGDGVITTDIHGYITGMNPIAEKLTGWQHKDARNRPLADVFNIIDATSRMPTASPVEHVITKGEIVNLSNNTILISKDEKEYRIADSGSPIRSRDNHIIGVVLIFRDVTQKHELQEQLRQSQKLEAIGQLAGGVAHDFNNMLTVIQGTAELLERKLADNAKHIKLLHTIIDSVQRAASLTNQLLTFARKNPTQFEVIDIHEPIKNTISLLKNTIDRRIKLIISFYKNDLNVIGDLSLLQNAFLNVGINATHAMPGGGTLHITTNKTILDLPYCQTSSFDINPGEYATIEIRDTGYGISPENLKRIFEPFFTTKKQGEGTGLGLSTVFGTIKQHSGEITIHSKVNEGTCIQVLLPLSDKSSIDTKGIELQPATENRKILLVDDELAIQDTASSLLNELGYKVIVASNGRQALYIFQAEHASIDLVLLDMMMPKMNGFDCFLKMQQIQPDVRAIMISGFTPDNKQKELKKAGLKGFIQKPFNAADLSQLIAKVLEEDKNIDVE